METLSINILPFRYCQEWKCITMWTLVIQTHEPVDIQLCSSFWKNKDSSTEKCPFRTLVQQKSQRS